MKRVLVTGGNGFIGSHLVESLLEQGVHVKCLVRETSNLEFLSELDIEFAYGDMEHPHTLIPAVRNVDVIFHLAGKTKCKSEKEFFEANAKGTLNLLKAVSEHNPNLKRFVFVSSLAAAGPGHENAPVKEDITPNPLTLYGKSKLKAEEYVLSFQNQFPVTILRPPTTFGPRDTDVFHSFLSVQRGVVPLVGKKDLYISIIYVKDLVSGIILSAKNKKAVGNIYFVVSDEIVCWKEFCFKIAEMMKTKARLIRFPLPILYAVTLFNQVIMKATGKLTILNYYKIPELVEKYWICSGIKIKDELRFKPEFSLETGLEETLDWYREAGWLKK